MGEARRRGSLEERKAAAIEKELEYYRRSAEIRANKKPDVVITDVYAPVNTAIIQKLALFGYVWT